VQGKAGVHKQMLLLRCAELFSIIGAAALEDDPGAALLRAASAAGWPILALLAACHSGTPVLSCLAVWLRASLHRSHAGVQTLFQCHCPGL
jgi:hypothetical protein